MKRPVVVAGGGLAGAAAAVGLAQAGVEVTLIERETGPVHKICGEFLSTEAQAYLLKLGLDVGLLGGAPISHLRLVRGADEVTAALPFRGIGLSRFRLDEALLRYASASGVNVWRGHTIRSVAAGEKIALEVAGLGVLRPHTLLLATGKHELRGVKRAVGEGGDLIGFKMYFQLGSQARRELEDHIDLIFFRNGYAGLQMVEDGLANFCLLVSRERFAAAGGSWVGLFDDLLRSSSYLARQMAGASPLLEQPLSIYRVPYGFVHQPLERDPAGLFRLGDQACVIQSFTGDGMSIALHSAALAVAAHLAGETSMAYHRRLASDVGGQIKRADALYRLMDRSAMQAGLFGLARLWPGGLRIAAGLTRVPERVRMV
jgi:flavin-dependent dehydrogenase